MKKHPAVFYITGAAVTAAVIIITQSDIRITNEFLNKYLLGIFSKGAFAGALWCVVMWVGAINGDTDPGKKVIKAIMPARGELSIFAAVITLAHAVTYSITYIKRFNLFRQHNISMKADFILTCLICIGLMVIMIPLTVLSIKKIRRKMNAKTWKNIQRAAYVFYGLILAHVLVLYIPEARNGNTERYISVLTYSAVFIGYGVMRLRKQYIRSRKPESKTAVNAVSAGAGVVLFALIAVLSHGSASEPSVQKKPAAEETTSAVTTTADTHESDGTATTSAVTTDKAESGTTVSTGSVATGTGSTSEGEKTDEQTTTTASEEDMEEGSQEQEESSEEEGPADSSQQEEQSGNGQSQQTPQPEAPDEPAYINNNGTFTGSGTSVQYGGGVTAKVTIENDNITAISVLFEVDDEEYYISAIDKVVPQIKNRGSTDGVDTVCGATHSADGIVEAVADALAQARK